MFDYFFIIEKEILERGLSLGFKLFGPRHLAWLAACAIFAVIMVRVYKNAVPEKRVRLKKFFAVALALSEVYKDSIIMIKGISMMSYLPLHLCSFTIFAMLYDAFGKKSNFVKQLMAYALMPGAVSALLFCNWAMYPMINFMCIHSFLFHGWIVAYVFMGYCAGEIRPNYKGLWTSIAFLAVMAGPVYFFNQAYGQNYMFISKASEGSPLVPLWNIFGERFGMIGYLLAFAALVVVCFHVFFLLYWAAQRLSSRGAVQATGDAVSEAAGGSTAPQGGAADGVNDAEEWAV